MPPVHNKDFNSDDFDFAAPHGKLRQQILYTSKGPTFEHENKTNRDRKPLIPELWNKRTRQYFHPREETTVRIQNNLKIAITLYL